ncbi:RNA-binding 27 [Pelobates cultripes]|uniref:RNA-binding 27 n=1 Tax=Pelobates cultripes TaxID=61616 RepID=A0AAD1RRU6_PELCU|nr:RNA-binding 27 [Pelobates cultripes]
MLIENVDAFKTWLAKLLDPICDADPSALANYVIALVKKDKSEKELKAICADQLDVFLQKETNGFVDKLFECLHTKDYLPQEEILKPEVKPEREEVKDEVAEKRHMAVSASLPETFEEERDVRKKKHLSPQRNRSDSNERRSRDRKREDGKWRDYDRHRDKYDWRRGRSKSPPKSKSTNRSRSRSRGRSRDREMARSRSGAKGIVTQQATSLTQHRERPKFECERSDLESVYTPCSSQSVTCSTEPQYSSGGQAIPSTVTVIAPAHHPENTTEIWSNYYNNHNLPNSFSRNPPTKRRCRDYDERGFCILGDLCQYDHGNDPLVVDDVSLPSMIPFPPPPGLPPPGILMPPIPGHHNMRVPVPGVVNQPPPSAVPPTTRLPLAHTNLLNNREQQGSNTVPSLAPIGGLPPPLPPQNLLYSVSEHTYEPDGYNPEAPSLTNTGRTAYRQFFTRTQTQRPNLIGLTSGDMDTTPRAANIIIQTEPPLPVPVNSNVNRVVVEPDRKRPLGSIDGPFAKKAWIDKQGSNNHNKLGFMKKIQYTNTKLEVRKIPQDLNNITKLNEHFSKFGTIVNIQVAFQGDPEGALIQYLTNEEARRAISSTEAVLNNRFIRVLWHRENNDQQPSQQQQHMTHHTQHTAQTVPSSLTATGHMPKVMSKPPNQGSYSLNKLPIKNRVVVREFYLTLRLSAQIVEKARADKVFWTGEAQQTLAPSTGHSKMVYSSPNLKSATKPSTGSKPVDAQEALKKKQEALKLQQDMRKKKQEMLEKRIEYQKMLISRLEKNKTMKAEERNEIMKTLKELDEKISQAKDELKTLSAPSKVKSKTEAQKELLDAEMDFHKRLTSGEDTTELRKKLSQLQVEAARLGILPAGRGGKTLTTQGRGRGRGRGARGRGQLNNMVVDHRPKTISVIGFYEKEKEELLQHFAKFGEVEDLNEEEFPPSVILTFKTRQEAENAANQGSKFKGRKLQVSWHKPKTPSVTTEIEEVESKEEENDTSDPFLHEDDDEDEDEDGSRYWRR